MREEMMKSVVSDLNGSSADDEDRVGAMAAAMLSLGERTAMELARGNLEQVMIKGDNGYVLLIHAGSEAVLSAIVRKEAKLGLVILDASRAAKAIEGML